MSKTISHIDPHSYNLLLQSIKDHAIMILDLNGYVLEWSRGAHAVKGYAADEIIGKHFSVLAWLCPDRYLRRRVWRQNA